MTTNSARMVTKLLYGTGSALTVNLGGIPDVCIVQNLTDGDRRDWWYRLRAMPFSSGGTAEITKGSLIVGATSGARARVKNVLLASGSWAGGDAAGVIIFDPADGEKTGTFSSENVYVYGNTAGSTNDATVTVDVDYSIESLATAESNNAANGITYYAGDLNNTPGVILGTDVSENDKLLFVTALWGDSRPYDANV